jgi:cytochrome P450
VLLQTTQDTSSRPKHTNKRPQVLGGADTLAIVIKAIFYHILKSPSSKAKLVAELHAANLQQPAPYTTIEHLPYLDACMKEGLRMHPVVGHIFERVVPATGLTLSNGTILPPGTIVGVNPWVIHYQEAIFGAKPHEFRPERWMRGEKEAVGAYEARIKKMKDADMAFGGGNRICIGRPLALVELYKVVATLFGKYEVLIDHDLIKSWDDGLTGCFRLSLRIQTRSGICISSGLFGRMTSRLR